MIAVRDDGTPWESEKDLQTRVSHYLRDPERDGLIGDGTTRPARLLRRLVEAERSHRRGSGRPARRQVAENGHPREDNVIRAFNRVKDAS